MTQSMPTSKPDKPTIEAGTFLQKKIAAAPTIAQRSDLSDGDMLNDAQTLEICRVHGIEVSHPHVVEALGNHRSHSGILNDRALNGGPQTWPQLAVAARLGINLATPSEKTSIEKLRSSAEAQLAEADREAAALADRVIIWNKQTVAFQAISKRLALAKEQVENLRAGIAAHADWFKINIGNDSAPYHPVNIGTESRNYASAIAGLPYVEGFVQGLADEREAMRAAMITWGGENGVGADKLPPIKD